MIWGRLAESEAVDQDEVEGSAAPVHEGDPAQALLNVLGRFQRHYLRGKEGSPQSDWSDDCMNALIDAVDVAVAQRWQEVVTVLTETARVLQTYEDAERANECVPFLTASHELLCHMVGDLLTGQVRPGLLRKWESLHERARADVDAAGLTLVQDEMSDDELVQEAFGMREEAPSPFDEPTLETESQVVNGEPEVNDQAPDEASPFELPELADEQEADSSESPVDDLPDLSEPGTVQAYAEESSPESGEAEGDSRILEFPQPDPVESTDPEPEMPQELASVEADAEPLELDLGEMAAADGEPDSEIEIPELSDVDSESDSITEPEETEPVEAVVPAGDDISSILDAACDALSNVHDDLNSFREHVRTLESRADELTWEGASAASRSVLRLLDMLEARNIEPTDRFLELAYGFSGVYVESRDSVDTDEYRSFQKDCISLLQDWMDDRATESDAVETDVEPVATEPADESNPDADEPELNELLNTVRAAMEGGRAANAKLLMLEAAARIAREQESEAEAKVGEAEGALSENTRALEAAREAVHAQENLVSETAARVTEVQHSQEAHRRQMSQLAEQLEEALSRVESLDEQIRELQNRRDAAESDRASAHEALDGARATEDAHESSLESAREDERNARLRLEEERREAKTLQSRRGDLERAVIARREALARQRQSTQDIEQTITHTRDAEPGDAASGGESLF